MSGRRWTPEEFARVRRWHPPSHSPPSFTQCDGERAFWPVTPTPWVRESNRDKFKPRKRVLRYRAFRDDVGWKKVWAPTPGDLVVFLMPIPKSWPKKKQADMDGQEHLQVPDVDNLTKALLDACYLDDAHIWTLVPAKVWSSTPGIYIERRAPAVAIPFVVPAAVAA